MSDWKDKPYFSQEEINQFFSMNEESETSNSHVKKEEEVKRTEVKTNRVEFQEFEDEDTTGLEGISLELLYDLPIEVSVRLGSVIMSIGELTDLTVGSVISLEKLAGDRAEIMVGDELLARGDVVVTIDKYSVVVKEVVQPRERIESIYNNLKTAKIEN